MKKLIPIILVGILAACGSGPSGGPIPTPRPTVSPTPTPTPKVQYTSAIVFSGALSGRQIQADLRQVELKALTSGTPPPIMVVSPIASNGTIGGSSANAFGGTVQAEVSPLPSATPSVTFSTTTTDVLFQTPDPSSSPQLPSGVVAQANVGSNPTVQNVQISASASAAIGSPVNQTPSDQVYEYKAISLECPNVTGIPMNPGSAPAWAWDGSNWNPVTNLANADIYMTGPHCTGQYASSEVDTTIHYPGGGTLVSTDNAFNSLLASNYVNSTGSFATLTQMIMQNGDGSENAEILFKAGTVLVKLFPNSIQTGTTPDFSGAIEVSGSSVDGF